MAVSQFTGPRPAILLSAAQEPVIVLGRIDLAEAIIAGFFGALLLGPASSNEFCLAGGAEPSSPQAREAFRLFEPHALPATVSANTNRGHVSFVTLVGP